ncbi:MAG: tetratricopeptide repeat protein, partial [Cytophagales bacterium]
MRNWVCLIYVLFFQFSVLAQTNAEKLEKMCQEAEDLIETNPKLANKKSEEFLVFAKKTFHPLDTNTAIAYLSYALIQSNAGKSLAFCLDYCDKAISILEKYKESHLKLHNNSFYYKGSIYFNFGDYNNASKYQTLATDFAFENDVYSLDEKIIFLANLIEINNRIGNHSDNHKMIEKVEVLLKNNPNELNQSLFLGYRNIVSNHYSALGDYETAGSILTSALEFAEQNNLKSEVSYFEALNNLVINSFEMNETNQAFSRSQQLLNELNNAQITESNLFFGALNILGVIYSEKGDLKRSDSCQALSLKKRLEVYGENHPSYWNSLSNYAVYLMKVGDFAKAAQVFKNVLNLIEKNNAQDSEIFENLLNNYIVFLTSVNVEKFDEAKKLLENNLKRVEKRFGKNHIKYWDTQNLLSTIFIAKKDFPNAEKLQLEYLQFLKSQNNKNKLDWSIANNNMAEFYANQIAESISPAILF